MSRLAGWGWAFVLVLCLGVQGQQGGPGGPGGVWGRKLRGSTRFRVDQRRGDSGVTTSQFA